MNATREQHVTVEYDDTIGRLAKDVERHRAAMRQDEERTEREQAALRPSQTYALFQPIDDDYLEKLASAVLGSLRSGAAK